MRDPDDPPTEPAGQRPGDQQPGAMRPVTDRALALGAVVGLVAGWSAHPVGERLTGRPPLVSWVQPLTLLLAAGVMGFLAWHTWRTVQVLDQRLPVHQAVNRLVLARACALGGAVVAGGYAGYAVTWLGDDAEPADRWWLRSVVAALAALGVMLGSLVLERACRAPGEEDRP